MLYSHHTLRYSILMLLSLMFFACEDVVTVDPNFQEKEIVVDAWLTNDGSPQTITLSYSQDYFDSSPYETIDDATVIITSKSKVYPFSNIGGGKYRYEGDPFGNTGDSLFLLMQVKGDTVLARTQLKRVPKADSIAIIDEGEGSAFVPGRFAEFYAKDFVGPGDTYWLKGWLNDTLLVRPRELTIIYDYTFAPTAGPDGATFIRPLRLGINAAGDDGRRIPLESGDKIYAELHSITNEAFFFLQTVQEQINNGDNNIFALPIANARGNVVNISKKRSVLGFFNVSQVSSITKIVE